MAQDDYKYPWSAGTTSWTGKSWAELVRLRWPRLVRAICRAAHMSNGEAACVIRALKDPDMPVGEAAYHYCKGKGAESMTTQDAARYIVQDALRLRNRYTYSYSL